MHAVLICHGCDSAPFLWSHPCGPKYVQEELYEHSLNFDWVVVTQKQCPGFVRVGQACLGKGSRI